MEKKYFEIIHYTYGDVCGDDYYGKKSEIVSCDVVFDTEEAVINAVKILNAHNMSYRREREPENEFDNHWDDEDYFYYRHVEAESVENFLKRRIRTR